MRSSLAFPNEEQSNQGIYPGERAPKKTNGGLFFGMPNALFISIILKMIKRCPVNSELLNRFGNDLKQKR